MSPTSYQTAPSRNTLPFAYLANGGYMRFSNRYVNIFFFETYDYSLYGQTTPTTSPTNSILY